MYLEGMPVQDINGEVIAQLRAEKLEEASEATVNRHMAWLRSFLRTACHSWEWIDKTPRVPMFRERFDDYRWLTKKEFKALAKHLPDYQRRCAQFAVSTGLRSGPIRSLTWQQVDMRRRVALIKISQSKNSKPLRVPLNDSALTVLRECKGASKKFVFTKDGDQVPREMVNRSWRRAVDAAELEGVRFHDLRHTWATWHAQGGTPLQLLKELGGWSSLQMVLRYAHHAPSDLDKWAKNVSI